MIAPAPEATDFPPTYHFFLRPGLAPELAAYVSRFGKEAGRLHRSRRFVRVTIDDAVHAVSFRLYFAGDILFCLTVLSGSAEAEPALAGGVEAREPARPLDR